MENQRQPENQRFFRHHIIFNWVLQCAHEISFPFCLFTRASMYSNLQFRGRTAQIFGCTQHVLYCIWSIRFIHQLVANYPAHSLWFRIRFRTEISRPMSIVQWKAFARVIMQVSDIKNTKNTWRSDSLRLSWNSVEGLRPQIQLMSVFVFVIFANVIGGNWYYSDIHVIIMMRVSFHGGR